jgi:ribosomal protein S4
MKYKKRHKPFYKQFLRLRQNIQDRPKLFRFKKQKWQTFQENLKKQLTPYRRFKIKDQFQLSVSKFAGRGNSFGRKFRSNLHERKIFSLFYGGLKKRYLKNSILKCIKTKNYVNSNLTDYRHVIFRFFESRLDTVIHRANFSLNIQGASQLILHGHVYVNGKPVKTKSYRLKPNDLVEIAPNSKSRILVNENINKSNFWPLPPKHLLINYKTLQILFVYPEDSNLMPVFHHYLNLDSVIANIKKA